MPRTKSSHKWLQEHFADFFVKKAQSEGYRSRAIYKIKEINEKEHLIKPGMTVVDLGASPGSWAQYVLQQLQGRGTLVTLDKLPMDALPQSHFILGDFSEDSVLDELQRCIPVRELDVLLSDMAPNMSGNPEVDVAKSMYLAELVFDFGDKMLKPGGCLLMKIFHGSGFDALVKQARLRFKKVSIRKPTASRPRSRETYLLAKDFNL